MKQNKSFLAWLVFIVIISFSIAFDFYLRKTSSNFYESGLDENIWFLLHALAFICFSLLIGNIKNFKAYIIKWIANIIPAFILYITSIYTYILGFGIDSF
jgi:hypothetical protein